MEMSQKSRVRYETCCCCFFWDLHFVGRESASSDTDWREVELLHNTEIQNVNNQTANISFFKIFLRKL